MSTPDVPAAKSFHTALFGRRCETDPREEAGRYTMAHLGDDRVAALSPVYQPGQPPAWTGSFAVEDADERACQTPRRRGHVPDTPEEQAP